MVCATGRIVPAQAMIIGVANPRVRGAFMSLNTAVQHLATGIAPLITGWLITKTDDGKMIGYPLVGLVAAGVAAVSLILGGLLRPAPGPVIVDSDTQETPDAVETAAA
jgi:MFS family permease